jgi:hypothetical protein
VIPVPFNQPRIATPTNPITIPGGEVITSSYGYQVLNGNRPYPTSVGGSCTSTTNASHACYMPISTEPYNTADGGNVDLRVPYIGYSDNAALFRAIGVSSYNALQAQVEKRMTHHIQAGVAYTFGHSLDEQSDVGLFFTGNNPNDLRNSYASSDFDRTHDLTFNYIFTLPDYARLHSLLGKFVDGWQLSGITIFQSGQPYSLYDFDGGVGSQSFGNDPTLTNPILPIKNPDNPRSALTGHSGAFQTGVKSAPYISAIDVTQISIPFIQPGQQGVPACSNAAEPCDFFETGFAPTNQRNIFRQSFQKRADVSLTKKVAIGERFNAIYAFNVFNVTNTPTFDVPNNNVGIGAGFVGSNSADGQIVSTKGAEPASQNTLFPIPAVGVKSYGAVQNTIGSARTIEMALHLNF